MRAWEDRIQAIALPAESPGPPTLETLSFTKILKFFGYLDAVAGAGVGIYFCDQASQYGASPWGNILAWAALLQGIFLCALFNVIAEAADDLRAIRALVAPQAVSKEDAPAPSSQVPPRT